MTTRGVGAPDPVRARAPRVEAGNGELVYCRRRRATRRHPARGARGTLGDAVVAPDHHRVEREIERERERES